MKKAALDVMPDAQVTPIPADGREGTLDVIRNPIGGSFVVHSVTGPCGQPVSARYLSAGDAAYVELAEEAAASMAAGFSAANTNDLRRTGEALNAGPPPHRDHLGGKYRDGRVRMAALGVRFHGAQQPQFHPNGRHARRRAPPHRPDPFLFESGVRSWSAVRRDESPVAQRLREGLRPRSRAMVETMEAGMAHLATIFRPDEGPEARRPACLRRRGQQAARRRRLPQRQPVKGSDALLDLMNFSALQPSLVVTGEGMVDDGGRRLVVVAANGRTVVVPRQQSQKARTSRPCQKRRASRL